MTGLRYTWYAKPQDDRPTAISSSAQGANVNALGFNLDLIAAHVPKSAAELVRIYNEVHDIMATDPKAPDEDFEFFNDALESLDSEPEDDSK